MEKSEREPWVTYLEGDVLAKEVEGRGRVYQVIIRVKSEGLQGVVKARAGDEYSVAFVGAGSLPGLSAKIRDCVMGEGDKWREDRYPPT